MKQLFGLVVVLSMLGCGPEPTNWDEETESKAVHSVSEAGVPEGTTLYGTLPRVRPSS